MLEAVLVWGFLGGALRGVVGFLKHRFSYKDVSFSVSAFGSSVALSGFVGVAVFIVAKEVGVSFLGTDTLSPALGVVIGYAGGDFLENLWKIIMKTPGAVLFRGQTDARK
ncbi:MAG: hypothetical protein HY482_01180 [Candidatus Wildermuthbacteria bacterium]|nr:hypothetical protein [Candidatus Wildermuthbacteria bacterium]